MKKDEIEDFNSSDLNYIEELDLPNRILPILATQHNCPKNKLGGKKWSTWVRREEICPLCGKMELDEDGNRLEVK
jgi:hypothetical protein